MADFVWATLVSIFAGVVSAHLGWTHEPVIVGILVLWFLLWATSRAKKA
jgi:hypothetical protein